MIQTQIELLIKTSNYSDIKEAFRLAKDNNIDLNKYLINKYGILFDLLNIEGSLEEKVYLLFKLKTINLSEKNLTIPK